MIENLNIWTLIAIFSFIILIFAGLFTFIFKKKKQKNLSLSSFSLDVKNMLEKISDPENKLKALEQLIGRIENDEKYKKTPDWKNSVLAKVYEHMAAVHFNMKNDNGIIEACSKVIELDPSNGMSYYNRGSVYNNLEQYEKAVKDFDNAIMIMPDYLNAYNNRGLALEKLGRYEEALNDYNYSIEMNPTAIGYYNRATLFNEQNKYAEALQDYKKYLELDENNISELKADVESAIESIEKKLSGNE